ncbi:MAG: hypothetical protein ACI4N3_05355 [Alphaproteobacteria bacterium]
MKKMNNILYLTTVGVISSITPTSSNAQTFYQCLPLSCSDGQYIKDGKCTSCPAGTYQKGNDRATSCSKCGAGTYSSTGASSCFTCPAGYYCPDGQHKYSCETKYYTGGCSSNLKTNPPTEYKKFTLTYSLKGSTSTTKLPIDKTNYWYYGFGCMDGALLAGANPSNSAKISIASGQAYCLFCDPITGAVTLRKNSNKCE